MKYLIAIIFLLLLIPVSSATTYTLAQGDSAYLNDTVDLSLVVTWPNYELAVCPDGGYGCANPTVVNLGNENQHRVLLSPSRFQVGTYWRWNGKWERGENMAGFEILSGVRAEPTPVPTFNMTNQTIIELVKNPSYDDTRIILCRGDSLEFNYTYSNTTANDAYIWLFKTNYDATMGDVILGDKMEYSRNDSVYHYNWNESYSEKFASGNYAGYIQYVGYNQVQDVYYDPSHQIVKFEPKVKALDTIFDDERVPDVNIQSMTPGNIKKEFERLQGIGLSDDVLIPINMTVYDPVIIFTDYYAYDDEWLVIDGLTPAKYGSTITFMLDPDRHVLHNERPRYTFNYTVEGSANTMRTFHAIIPINWEDMPAGNHTIVASITKPLYSVSMNKDFNVGIYVEPTQRPVYGKIISDDYGWHVVTPTPEETEQVFTTVTTVAKPEEIVTKLAPNVTYQSNESYVLVDNEIPSPTTKVTTKPTTASVNVPIPILIVIASIAVAFILVRRKP